MELSIRGGLPHERRAGVAAFFLFERERSLKGAAANFDRASGGALRQLLASGDFSGRWLETGLLYPTRGSKSPRVLVVGLGASGELTGPRLLQAAATAARRARGWRARVMSVDVREELATPERLTALAEGVVLGHYAFTAYRTNALPPLKSIEWMVRDTKVARRLAPAVAYGMQRAEATCVARDLASTPGQDLVPDQLAERAKEVAENAGATARVLREPCSQPPAGR